MQGRITGGEPEPLRLVLAFDPGQVPGASEEGLYGGVKAALEPVEHPESGQDLSAQVFGSFVEARVERFGDVSRAFELAAREGARPQRRQRTHHVVASRVGCGELKAAIEVSGRVRVGHPFREHRQETAAKADSDLEVVAPVLLGHMLDKVGCTREVGARLGQRSAPPRAFRRVLVCLGRLAEALRELEVRREDPPVAHLLAAEKVAEPAVDLAAPRRRPQLVGDLAQQLVPELVPGTAAGNRLHDLCVDEVTQCRGKLLGRDGHGLGKKRPVHLLTGGRRGRSDRQRFRRRVEARDERARRVPPARTRVQGQWSPERTRMLRRAPAPRGRAGPRRCASQVRAAPPPEGRPRAHRSARAARRRVNGRSSMVSQEPGSGVREVATMSMLPGPLPISSASSSRVASSNQCRSSATRIAGSPLVQATT